MRSLLSERMSTLARAAWAIALTLDPALDQPHVDGRFRRTLQARFGEQRHRPAERVQRIAHAVIAPAMPARAGETRPRSGGCPARGW